MDLKKYVETIYESKVELRQLQEEIRKMESELIMECLNHCPDALSINYSKLDRMLGIEPLRYRLMRSK